jgi:hypothetical protein
MAERLTEHLRQKVAGIWERNTNTHLCEVLVTER